MPYTIPTWINEPSTATPLSADNLNQISAAIQDIDTRIVQRSVKEFGAIGDGTTDDTAAINSAISTSDVGSLIWFPAGTYKVTSSIILYPNRTYAGAGGLSGMTTINAVSSVTGGILVGYGWQNNILNACDAPIRIQGLKVAGAGKGVGTAHGIVLVSFWVRITDVFVANTGADGIRFTDQVRSGAVLTSSSASCSENKITNCKIDSTGAVGFHAANQAAFNTNADGHVDDCQISGTAQQGIFIEQSAGWHISGNHLYGIAGNGIQGSSGYGTKIIGNYVEDFGSQNTVSTNYAGIRLNQGGGWASIVSNNTINTSQGGNSTTATQWACINCDTMSSATAATPSVVAVIGNTVTNDIAGATTKKSYGFYFETSVATAGAAQIRTAGNFIDATGWTGSGSPLTGAQFVTNTTNVVVNGTITSF